MRHRMVPQALPSRNPLLFKGRQKRAIQGTFVVINAAILIFLVREKML